MSKNGLIVLAVIVIILIVGVIFLTRTSEIANTNDNADKLTENGSLAQDQNQNKENETAESSPDTNGSENNGEKTDKQATVIYGENGFEPKTLMIKKGTTVVFKNERNVNMWVASAIHPSHEVYPEKGGCISSAFDACKGYAKGESWPFQFNVVGTWKYHDHLNASQFGSIVVTE